MERPIFAIEPEAFFVAKLPGGGDVVDSVTIGPGGFHATVNGRPTEQRPVTSEGHVHMLVRVSQDGMRVSALPRGLVGLCPVVEGPVPADDPTPLVPRHQPSPRCSRRRSACGTRRRRRSLRCSLR